MTEPLNAAAEAMNQYRAVANAIDTLIPAAIDGATVLELRTRLLELAPHLNVSDAHRIATRLYDDTQRSKTRAQQTRAALAAVIAGYPANTWRPPVIVNAAPIGGRSSVFAGGALA
jgi:hypothetical protein